MVEEFYCNGYIGSSDYISPHKSNSPRRVVLNEGEYKNWVMCFVCHETYMRDRTIQKLITRRLKEKGIDDLFET